MAAVLSRKRSDKGNRSAAYAARCEQKISLRLAWLRNVKSSWHTPSVWHPVSVMVDSFGTGTVSDEILAKAVEQVFDLRPAAIIQRLDLRRPIYRQLAAYGHMGREDLSVAWER